MNGQNRASINDPNGDVKEVVETFPYANGIYCESEQSSAVHDKDYEPADSIVCACDTQSLKTTITELEAKITDLNSALASEKKKVRVAETEVNSQRLRLEAWREAFLNFSQQVQENASTPGKCQHSFLMLN